MLGGHVWPDELWDKPLPDYLSSKGRSFTVRLPRYLLTTARVHAAEAGIRDQEMAVRVFDWYLRTGKIPPKKEELTWTDTGTLAVDQQEIPLFEFRGRTTEEILDAFDILREQRKKFGTPPDAKDMGLPLPVVFGSNRPSPKHPKTSSSKRRPHRSRSPKQRRGR
ncbi:MAG: hypothetical protein L3K16_08820 [Thermoplasmata archaeon]|nr:hypothetical protein [Thermoplasmata archaeon]